MNKGIESHNSFKKADGTPLTGKVAIEYFHQIQSRTPNLNEATGQAVLPNELLIPRNN